MKHCSHGKGLDEYCAVCEKMSEAEESLKRQVAELTNNYGRAVEKLRLAHLDIRSRDETIASLRLELGSMKYALSRARFRGATDEDPS